MKVLVDENVPRKIVLFLRNIGLEVIYVAENPKLRGAKNQALIIEAFNLDAILLTYDSDFLAYEGPWKIVYLEQTNDPLEMVNILKQHIDTILKELSKNRNIFNYKERIA